MQFDIDVYFRGDLLTRIYNVEADTQAEAIDTVRETLEVDFEVVPYD